MAKEEIFLNLFAPARRIKFEETEALLLRVMTSTVILYDHVHPSGAFVKGKFEYVVWNGFRLVQSLQRNSA